ncbi:MAG TPA: BON domain-containing protein, partial [Thermoanaerobaculia bacterium]|nr:BON domain-containing protein [Thermoanaerobaculia bacterium]
MRVRPTTIVTSALALGAGAGLMYLLDPQGGRRRRALLKDKARHGAHEAGDKVSAVATDVGNRARGLTKEAVGRLRNEELTDEQLAQRVRSTLGHHTDHAGAIEVLVHDGRVTLAGPAV